MSNWINVNNGLPEDGAPILMTEWEQEQHPIVLAGFYRDGKWRTVEDTEEDEHCYDVPMTLYNVTHWMPYPEPAQPAAC